MTRPMLDRLEVQNYGCIKEETFELSPLHAFIGPNDSGKSTVLRCLRTLSELARFDQGAFERGGSNWQALMANATAKLDVRLATRVDNRTWHMLLRGGAGFEQMSGDDGFDPSSVSEFDLFAGSRLVHSDPVVHDALARTQMLRLDPDALRLPSFLLIEGYPLKFTNEHGRGLSGVIDALLGRRPDIFFELNTEIRALFPVVKSLSLKNLSDREKALGVQLTNGTYVGAEHMSEGLLYYLAYAVLRHLEPTALLLIEEPENGLHPARIADVMAVLREISKETQVILTTHNPLVINELEGHEVSVLTRTEEHGTKAVLMKDTPNFDERRKVYALGELWLSYADGTSESALLKGGSPP